MVSPTVSRQKSLRNLVSGIIRCKHFVNELKVINVDQNFEAEFGNDCVFFCELWLLINIYAKNFKHFFDLLEDKL